MEPFLQPCLCLSSISWPLVNYPERPHILRDLSSWPVMLWMTFILLQKAHANWHKHCASLIPVRRTLGACFCARKTHILDHMPPLTGQAASDGPQSIDTRDRSSPRCLCAPVQHLTFTVFLKLALFSQWCPSITSPDHTCHPRPVLSSLPLCGNSAAP